MFEIIYSLKKYLKDTVANLKETIGKEIHNIQESIENKNDKVLTMVEIEIIEYKLFKIILLDIDHNPLQIITFQRLII